MIADLPMPIAPAVVLSETAELSAEEFGAYTRLTYHLWARGGKLPAADAALARLAGVDGAQWPRVWQAIGHLFDVSGTTLTQAALSEALAVAEADRADQIARAEAASAKGAAMAASRWRTGGNNGGGESGQGGGGTNGPGGRHSKALSNAASIDTSNAGSIPPSKTDSIAQASEAAFHEHFDGGFGGSVSDPDLSLLSSGPRRSGSGSGSGKDRVGSSAAEIRAVFTHYRQWHPRATPNPRSDSKEWRAIAARLREGRSVEDLCRAIDGYHRDPWHCGENDRHKAFLDLGLICRTGEHVQRGLEYADDPNIGVVTSVRERRTARAIANCIERHKAPERPSWMLGISSISQTA
jgi:uncharacterized protein YdaU (DUF1376 family)